MRAYRSDFVYFADSDIGIDRDTSGVKGEKVMMKDLLITVLVILALCSSIGLVYWIGNSDLPLWIKLLLT